MLEYAFACLGSNILYILTNYGVVAATVQAAHSVGTIMLCQSTTGASLTTATVVAMATTTPFIRMTLRPMRGLFSRNSFQRSGHR